MQAQLSQFERHQLDVIARVTPHAMAGHLLNSTVLAVALAGSIPGASLTIWCLYSYAIGLALLYRHWQARGRIPRNFRRAARRATLYALLLALPWSSMIVLYLGALAHDEEMILVALCVGMAASGTVLLSAVPAAAFAYMSGILVPAALKCLLLISQTGYLLLGVLAVSYWWFLAALITKVTREIEERKQADVALNESEARLREALTAGHVVAFTWDPNSGQARRSQNAAEILGCAPDQDGNQSGDFLTRVHHEDRARLTAQIAALTPENPSYTASFRFVRPDGQEMWLEETGKAEFDPGRRYPRLEGLTRDVTERKRAEERQRLLIRELDHRVKNTLASVTTVAQRTREGSGSMDEFLQVFDGRIQSMANAHALLSRNRWQGVSLADLAHSELAPYVGEGSVAVEGPDVVLTAEATQPVAIVLHELVTNASKYGALTSPQGRISLRWAVSQDGADSRLLLEWTETGGPVCRAPIEAGYGTRAIRSLIPYELGGTVELAFGRGGVDCSIALPSKCLSRGGEPANRLKVPAADHLSGARLSAAP
jgi:PAS domain S-box-containing protein